jgi:hypothetical protein
VAAAFPVGNKMMAYPRGQIKSYGSCSRHLLRELFLQLGKYIFPVRKNIFPIRHKKSLRPEAIGETVALPDRLLSSCFRRQR